MDREPRSLAEVWALLRASDGPQVEQQVRRRLLGLAVRTAAVDKPGLLLVTGTEPLSTTGLWMPELAELCGATLLGATKGEGQVPVDPALVQQADRVIVACRGLDLAANIGVALTLGYHPALFAADGAQHFHAPAAALGPSAEMLVQMLHGIERFPFGHEGRLWQKI